MIEREVTIGDARLLLGRLLHESDWLADGNSSQAAVRSLEEAIEALTEFGVPLRARVAA